MRSNEKLVLVKNAVANVVRGCAAASVAIALPPFLTRLMSPDAYGAWSLVLQLSAFVGYLDFGIQTAVGRFFAHAAERGDSDRRDRIISTSMAALTAACLLGIAGTIGLAFSMPHVFHQVPASILSGSRWALLIVGFSLAVGLPFSVFNGIFVGLQRFEVPAVVIGFSRIVNAVLLVFVAKNGAGLMQMGATVATINMVSYGLQYVFYRKLAPRVQFSARLVTRKTGRELFSYCGSLTIWSFAMLLVNGLDMSLVGYFDFQKTAFYSVAAGLVVFLAGLQNALFNAMIPSTAVLQARGNASELGRVMITATRYGTFALLLIGLPLVLFAKSILTTWVGLEYALQGSRILQILTIANMIRLSPVPYSMTLIGTGQQRLVTLTPLLEGSSNLFASLFAGHIWGATGIAAGTLFGAGVGVCGNYLYNMRHTTGIDFGIAEYFRDGLCRPLICGVPLIAVCAAKNLSDSLVGLPNFAVAAFGAIATAFLIWHFGLVASERDQLRLRYFATEG